MDERRNARMTMTASLVAAGVAGGLGGVITFVIVLPAAAHGWLFSGLDQLEALVGGAFFCAVIVLTLGILARKKAKKLSWAIVGGVVLTVPIFCVLLWGWSSSRAAFRVCFSSPVPRGVVIHRGHRNLFGVWMYFSAPPEDVVSLIRSRQLKLVGESDEDSQGIKERARSVDSELPLKWWQPQALPHAKFYYRIHGMKETSSPWSEGCWVDESGTGVYACYGG